MAALTAKQKAAIDVAVGAKHDDTSVSDRVDRQAATVAAVATADADATYGAPEAALINELKAQVNAMLVALKAAGLMS